MKSPELTSAQASVICLNAVADLWERDIANLQKTKQPGGEKVCRELKKAVKELRGQGRKNEGVNP